MITLLILIVALAAIIGVVALAISAATILLPKIIVALIIVGFIADIYTAISGLF